MFRSKRPLHFRRWGRPVLAAWLVMLTAGAAAGVEDLDGVLDVRIGANVESVDSQQRIDQLADQTDQLYQQYKGILTQIDALRVYNRQLKDLSEAQDEEIAQLESEISNVTTVGRQITPLMLQMIESLEQFVELDVPFLAEERERRVRELNEMMLRADVSDSEKFRRLLEAYQVENEYGRTIESYRGDLGTNGTSRTVDFLRIGRIALLYQTLDSRETGIWDAREGTWKRLDNEYRSPVRHGMRIARKQAAPDLIRLPLPAPEAGGE